MTARGRQTHRLDRFGLSDMVACGRALRAHAANADGLAPAADAIVRWLYDSFRTRDGERACVLARCFVTRPFAALDADQRAFATAHLGDAELDDRTTCLTLVGTAGDEPEWNDPASSRGHRVLPLPSAQVVDRSPMISQLLDQFGLDVDTVVDPRRSILLGGDDDGACNVFHVEDAVGSPYVPAQSFVDRYGIRSVLGFGAPLPDGELFAVILFTRVPVPREVAERFESVALSAKLALLPLLDHDVDLAATSPARVRTLEDLIAVHESVVAEQGRALESNSRMLRGLTQAAYEVNAVRDLEDILDAITTQARRLVGTHQAVTSLTVDQNWGQAITSVELSDKYAAWRDYDVPPDGSGIYAEVCRTNRPFRMTQLELEAHPAFAGYGAEARRHPPMRGWLAAPLIARDGQNLGLIQLSDKVEGEFTAEDEATLVQLASLASLALENARLAEAEALREGARFRQELLAGISHDMKTPLAAVVGLTEALLVDPELPPEDVQAALAALRRQARALQALVVQFLDYARLEAGRGLDLDIRPTGVRPIVTAAAELFVHSRRVEVDLPDELPLVQADPQRFEQVVSNLLSNAAKFSHRDEPIVVQVQPVPGELRLSVCDRGTGLDQHEVHNLFQKFYRGSNARGRAGTGLGLYISRLLVEAMGGRIEVDSTPGEGSRFTVTLPAVAGVADATPGS